MSALPLTLEQISEDLESIEDHGAGTEILAQLVKASGAELNVGDQKIGEISEMMSRIAKMKLEEIDLELSRVNSEFSSSKEKLHEAVFESGSLFVKIFDWMKETRKDFEHMKETLKLIQNEHDSVINMTTANPGKLSS